MIYKIGGKGMERVDVPANHAKNNLANGTVLKLIGYSNPEYVIIEKMGVDTTGHGARYKTVNLQDFSISQHDTLGMDHIKDQKDHLGIHLFYTDEVLDSDEVLDIYAYAQKVTKHIEKIKKQEAEARKQDCEALPGKYPHLETLEKSKKSPHALGAGNLKRELQQAFPGVKFSVKSSSFAGGDSIDVHWNDGPLTKDVDKIADKYEEGSFDGMEDLYTYNNALFPRVFGGAKYVMSQRSVSGESIKVVAKKLGYDVELDKWDCIANQDHETKEMIMREVWATDFYQRPKEQPTKSKPSQKASGVVVGEYKGHPTITLPTNGKGFTFGLSKAKAILANIEEIKKFAEAS